uniref:Major sperm protein n=1 Tax=Acrobeloides nanus TaxID=290746 RepID=A0A914DYB7_9BILA
MELLQWMLAGLLQCFIASMILMQCSGKKRDKNRQIAKKTEPPKEEEALEPAKVEEKPSKIEIKDKPEPKNESEGDKENKASSRSAKESLMHPTQVSSVKGDPTKSARSDSKPITTPATSRRTTQASNTKSVNATRGDPNEVKITPDKLRFKDGEDQAKVQIQNLTDKPLAFKLKCSDNEIYKFKPVFFFLKPSEQHEHQIKRQPGAKHKPDKLLVVYTEAKDSEDAKKIYELNPAAKELIVGLIMA